MCRSTSQSSINSGISAFMWITTHCFQSDGSTGLRQTSTIGIAGLPRITSAYFSIPCPARERWFTTRKPIQSGPDRHFCRRPGQYQYYRSPNAKHWELKFITLNISCLKIWNDLAERFGRVFDLPADSAVMRCWDGIYHAALENEMGSFYTASGHAYQFMMQLYNTLTEQANTQSMSDVVQRCMALIQTEYKNELDLDYLSKACNVSVPYLSKRFQEELHASPIQYLNRYRIEVASSLLLRSRNRIEDIAHEVGFSDANYFAPGFQKSDGLHAEGISVARSPARC